MKTACSMTTIKKMYDKVFCAGYCDLQKIMRYHEPSYYNYGVYGWNNDTYTVYDFASHQAVAISTGYRNTRGPMIKRDLINKYNAEADAIEEAFSGQYGSEAYNRKRDEYADLRTRFIAEVLAQ